MQFRPDQPLVHVVWVDGSWAGFKLTLKISHTTLILSVTDWNLSKWQYGQKANGGTGLTAPLEVCF